MLEKFINACNKLKISDFDQVYVAFSGGMDSSVLLDLAYRAFKSGNLIAKLTDKLKIIHVDHGLSHNADLWVQHCQKTCNILDLELQVLFAKSSIKNKNIYSPEEQARNLRRAAWEKFLPENSCLLLAHHQEDQIETILQRLFRGAGPKGLSGIPSKNKLGKSFILRPLLEIAKIYIINYAEKNNLTWVSDESNLDNRYDRNFLRNVIIPKIKSRWPAVSKSVSRSGMLCEKTLDFIKPIINTSLIAAKSSAENILSINKLMNLTETHRHEVLRAWFNKNNFNFPSASSLFRLEKEVIKARIDSNPCLKLEDCEIRRYRDDLYVIERNSIQEFNFTETTWDMQQPLELPDGKLISIRKNKNIKDSVWVCTGTFGEKSKKIFQDFNIPPWERTRYFLIFKDNNKDNNKKNNNKINKELISILDLWVNPKFMENYTFHLQ